MHADTRRALALAALLALATPALAHDDDDDGLRIVRSSITCQRYDGVSDDLLTAGLATGGLQSAVPPPVVVPTNPTAAELRRR